MPGAECHSDKIFLIKGVHSLKEKRESKRERGDKMPCPGCP